MTRDVVEGDDEVINEEDMEILDKLEMTIVEDMLLEVVDKGVLLVTSKAVVEDVDDDAGMSLGSVFEDVTVVRKVVDVWLVP